MPARDNQHLRELPVLPPKNRRLPVIIDSDAACEVDDQHAITLALLAEERLEIKGFIGAQFGDRAGVKGPEQSAQEIEKILGLMNLSKQYPVFRGCSCPLPYRTVPSSSKGVDFILDCCQSSTQEQPIWIVGLGPATDIASAYLIDPSIADRCVVLWHGRTRWPQSAWNVNVFRDLRAAQLLLESRLPLILFDTGTNLICPMTEAESRIEPYGGIGKYLVKIRRERDPQFSTPRKGIFDLGDIAFLINPDCAKVEQVNAPSIKEDLRYSFKNTHGKILRVADIDRDAVFRELYKRLEQRYSKDIKRSLFNFSNKDHSRYP